MNIADHYLKSFEQTWSDETPIKDIRFIALDCETSGLNAQRDAIISIGAVIVKNGEIRLDEQFERILVVSHNTSSVLVHGISKEEADEEGVDEKSALQDFLTFLSDAVIVGHHIGFDIEILGVATERHFGTPIKNRWIDTMELTLNLEKAGAFDDDGHVSVDEDGQEQWRDFSLDSLCRRFQVAPHDRHTAGGDAFITAQIFQQLLNLTTSHDFSNLSRLCERYSEKEA